MRRKLSCFMAIAVALSMGFSSCSKSDPSPAEEVAKEYPATEVKVTNGGVEIPGATIKITAITENKAELILTNIVNGFPEFKVEAEVLKTKAEFSFTGSKDVDGMKVSVSGTVIDGAATVDVKSEITAKEILGAWNFSTGFGTGALAFDVKTKDGKLTYYGDGEPKEWKDSAFSEGINSMVGMMLPGMFPEFALTFQNNGYVGVKGVMSALITSGDSKNFDIPNLARYYYNPTAKVLIFDAPLAGLLGKPKATAPILPAVMQVPFNCSFDKDGRLTATIDSKLIAALTPIIPTGDTLEALLVMLDKTIPPALIEAGLLPWIKGNIKTIAEVLTDSKNLESVTIGGRLIPAKK